MAIWDALLRFWTTIYTGMLNRILVDQGSALGKSEQFESLAVVQIRPREVISTALLTEHRLGGRYCRMQRTQPKYM